MNARQRKHVIRVEMEKGRKSLHRLAESFYSGLNVYKREARWHTKRAFQKRFENKEGRN